MLTCRVRLVPQCRHLIAYAWFVASACIVFNIRIIADVYIVSTKTEDTPVIVMISYCTLLTNEVERFTISVIVHAHRIADHAPLTVFASEVTPPATICFLNL